MSEETQKLTNYMRPSAKLNSPPGAVPIESPELTIQSCTQTDRQQSEKQDQVAVNELGGCCQLHGFFSRVRCDAMRTLWIAVTK